MCVCVGGGFGGKFLKTTCVLSSYLATVLLMYIFII